MLLCSILKEMYRIVAQWVELHHHMISADFEEGDDTPCILGKDLTLGQPITSNFSRERRLCSASGKVTQFLYSHDMLSDRREVQKAHTSSCGEMEMDTKSSQYHISRDMRLVLFCNNCSGKEASPEIFLYQGT
jgi:hypothetical protein